MFVIMCVVVVVGGTLTNCSALATWSCCRCRCCRCCQSACPNNLSSSVSRHKWVVFECVCVCAG